MPDPGLQLSKFAVFRNDGSSRAGLKHAHCQYYVLDLNHDKFSIPALRAYIRACRKEYPALARDLTQLISVYAIKRARD